MCWMHRVALGVAAAWLAACGGGGGGGGSGIDPRLARLDIYEAQKLRVLGDPGAGVMGMAPTDPAAMPNSGTVAFTGSASIRVEAAAPLVLSGDVSLDVTFDDGSVSGIADNFFGTNSAAAVVDYAGALALDGGTVGVAAANALTFEHAGALTAPGEVLVFDGTLSGRFLDTPLGAFSVAELEAVVHHNGSATDATIVAIGELAE